MTWLSDPDLYMTFLFRFHPDEKAKRNPLVHMPFGWGPRNCVGLRFALMEAKMAMLSVLKKFKFERAPETEVLSCLYSAVTSCILLHPQVPIKTRLTLTLGPVNGIHLKVVARV